MADRELREAVERWVRADYAFRLGPNAYHGQTTDWLVEAERHLRETLTGCAGLRGAARELGVDTTAPVKRTPNPVEPRKRAKRGMAPSGRVVIREGAKGTTKGLFD